MKMENHMINLIVIEKLVFVCWIQVLSAYQSVIISIRQQKQQQQQQ